jgi:alcohol dehydrogenase class IV
LSFIEQGQSNYLPRHPDDTEEKMRFEFATASRIIFGGGAAKGIGKLAAEMGSSAFVVADENIGLHEPIVQHLKENGVSSVVFDVASEPSTTSVEGAVEQARREKSDIVIGIGGGSVIDTGKAVAVMLTNPGQLEDYLEVVGLGKKLTEPAVPYIAVPTTAGTGAEVTRNAVLRADEHNVKVSMRSGLMLPRVALVDPELTCSMPPPVTASTGLDALTQLMEAYVSNKANPLTDGLCREGIFRAARSLQKAYENGGDKQAREDMSLASLFGGLALANAKLGAVHGFAGPLGGMFAAAHGALCARLLPYVMETNIQALQNRAADSPALARYDEVAQILTGNARARAAEGLEWVRQLCAKLNVPSLAELGLKQQDVPAAVAKAQKSSSMKGNPVELTQEELTAILRKSL